MDKPTSQDVEQLVSTFLKHQSWPKADSPEDIVHLMSDYVNSSDGASSTKSEFPTSNMLTQSRVSKYQYNCLL